MPERLEIEALLTQTLHRLGQMGVKDVLLFSGHFADEQLQMIDEIAQVWNALGDLPLVKAFAVNRADVPSFPPDHAGLFETTLLDGLTDGLIAVPSLGTGADQGDRFDPASPLWGIVGADPREIPPVERAALVSRVVEAIVSLDWPN